MWQVATDRFIRLADVGENLVNGWNRPIPVFLVICNIRIILKIEKRTKVEIYVS